MRSTFLLTATLPRHGYANRWRADLGVVVLRVVDVVLVEIFGLISMVVDRGLVSFVCVVRGVVIMAINDVLARLANSQIARLSEKLA